jgi:hypothetical protein
LADRCFKRFQSTVRPFEESRHLIEAVPYRFLAGALVLLGSLGPIIVP